MIHLHYANHLEHLIAPLAAATQRSDPFTPQTIVIPNRNLQQWLNLHLAEHQGIAINLDFQRLDPLLADILAGDTVELISDWALQALVMERLSMHLAEQHADFEHVRAYLAGDGDPHQRLFQLAQRLVQLFREYAFARRQMLSLWRQDGLYCGPAHPVERWQKVLWLEIFGADGHLHLLNQSREVPLTSLTQLPLPPLETPSFAPLHIFGISYISRFHQLALKALAQHGDISLYVLNPCREFWEDVPTLHESRRLTGLPPIAPLDWARGEIGDPLPENPLLQTWGKPGREYFRLINDLGDWDFHEHFQEPDRTTLLGRIQYDILQRLAPPAVAPAGAGDDSLQVLACAGPRREAETVASHLWSSLCRQPDLDLKDVAVLVTDMQLYQAEIENAFQRIHHIPFNLVDGVSGKAARLIDAVRLLLDLPSSQFERDLLFRLYQHPNFQARFPEADTHRWIHFADHLNIYYGRDRRHQNQKGVSYLSGDRFNWDQGFKRLLLGPYFHGGGEKVFQQQGDAYAVYNLGETESDDAGRFFTITQSLFSDTGDIEEEEWPAEYWGRYLRGLIATYLAPTAGEERDFERILAITDQFLDIAALHTNQTEEDRPHLPFAIAKAFMVQELDRLRPFYNQYLADGVTVSSFMPMRPIPFKLIYVMGLNEGAFPAPKRKDTLDLRWARLSKDALGNQPEFREREIGDVSEQERDRYMFLETVVSVRERLVLSYVDRDEQTDDPRNPASVLAEMLYQAQRYQADFQVQVHPLKSYSSFYRFQYDDPAPNNNHDPFALRLARARDNFRRTTRGEAALNSLPAIALATPSADENDTLIVSLSEIQKFLESPLQANAKRTLGLRDQEEDAFAKLHEPFTLAALTRYQILNRVLGEVLQAHVGDFGKPPVFENSLDQGLRKHELLGEVPGGPLHQLTREQLQFTLQSWFGQLAQQELSGAAARFGFGGKQEHIAESYRCEPIRLELMIDGRPRQVEIHGQTQYVFNSDGTPSSVYFNQSLAKTAINDMGKHLFKSWVDALALSAAGKHAHTQGVMITTQRKTVAPVAFNLEKEQALSYLKTLLRDMLQPHHHYLAPGDLILKMKKEWHQPNAAERFRDRIDQIRTQENEIVACQYGPLKDWQDFPAAHDIEHLVTRRFGLLFEKLGVEGFGAGEDES